MQLCHKHKTDMGQTVEMKIYKIMGGKSVVLAVDAATLLRHRYFNSHLCVDGEAMFWDTQRIGAGCKHTNLDEKSITAILEDIMVSLQKKGIHVAGIVLDNCQAGINAAEDSEVGDVPGDAKVDGEAEPDVVQKSVMNIGQRWGV
eukprot:gene10608-7730_t